MHHGVLLFPALRQVTAAERCTLPCTRGAAVHPRSRRISVKRPVPSFDACGCPRAPHRMRLRQGERSRPMAPGRRCRRACLFGECSTAKHGRRGEHRPKRRVLAVAGRGKPPRPKRRGLAAASRRGRKGECSPRLAAASRRSRKGECSPRLAATSRRGRRPRDGESSEIAMGVPFLASSSALRPDQGSLTRTVSLSALTARRNSSNTSGGQGREREYKRPVVAPCLNRYPASL